MTAFNASSVDAEIPDDQVWIASLKAACRAQALNQSQVARSMGTCQSEVSRIESGLAKPSAALLARYAAAVGYRMVLTFEPLEGNEK